MAQLPPLVRARRHLSRKDPLLKQGVARIGPCTLQLGVDSFLTLVRSIVSQLISTKAALAVFGRLQQAFPAGLTPAAVLTSDEATLRGAGLSQGKAQTIRTLAERIHQGNLDLENLK